MFLGQLRDSELERINDRVGQAIIETLLAMTIFRQDFTASFFAAFVILSFIKILHWLVQDRVDFIETTPHVTRLQYVRIVAFLVLLVLMDWVALHYSLGSTLTKGVSVHLLFAFEYAVQISTAIVTLVKFFVSVIDMATGGQWEGKGAVVFYLDLALDLFHLIVYFAFFAVVFTTYGIPIHLVRDLYWTFRNFHNRVRAFLRYRQVAANMDRRFPDATEEDLQRADHVCIVCREEMTGQTSRAKRLDCLHCFHQHCLRSWLERQQNCPICRAPVLATTGQRPGREGQHGQHGQHGQQQQNVPNLGQQGQRDGHEGHIADQRYMREAGAGQEDGIPFGENHQEQLQQLQQQQQQFFYQYLQHYQGGAGMTMFVPPPGAQPMQFAGQESPEASSRPVDPETFSPGIVPVVPVTMLVPLVPAPWTGGAENQTQQPPSQEEMAAAVVATAATIAAMNAAAAMSFRTQAREGHSAPAAPAAPTAPAAPAPQEGAQQARLSEAEELRRRRLQRFQPNPANL